MTFKHVRGPFLDGGQILVFETSIAQLIERLAVGLGSFIVVVNQRRAARADEEGRNGAFVARFTSSMAMNCHPGSFFNIEIGLAY